ncbi:MAG: hypothetical protein KAJ10_10295, partial [Thermodesulfovibrionia bacterium]|nr:hypothetical protein [Thermodesulfovibrionia bacterium]
MSILFCTPAYGSIVTLAYFNSCLKLQESLLEAGIDHSWLTTGNESLITRARNTSVASFLKTDFEYLMFIDADIEFEPEAVQKLWNMEEKVAVGAYSMKRIDKPVSAWKDGKLVKLEELDGITGVDFAGTGFMLIHRGVFEDLKPTSNLHQEGKVGDCWAFFDTGVEDGYYISEDYFFCKRWREHGGKIMLDPSIKLKHHGTYAY